MSDETEILEATEVQMITTPFKVCVFGYVNVVWEDLVDYIQDRTYEEIDASEIATETVRLNDAIRAGHQNLQSRNPSTQIKRFTPNEDNMLEIQQYVYGEVDYEPGESIQVICNRIANKAQELALAAGPGNTGGGEGERTVLNAGNPLDHLLTTIDSSKLRDYKPIACQIYGEGLVFGEPEPADHTYG